MQKKYTRKTNPINNTGYTPGYSTESNPFNIIPSENITMRNTPYPVQGTPLDENGRPIGNSIMMQPGQDYKFGGASFVFETPKFASGGTKESWISEKIAKLIREGRPQQQAVAIAYSMWEQKHANGGYQLPMYQLAGTAELDAFGQPITNGQGTTAGATNIMGQPQAPTGDATTLAGATNNTRPQLTALGEGLQPAGLVTTPVTKPMASMTLEEDTEANTEKQKNLRKDVEEGTGLYQFNNPYGGYSMQDSLFNAGKSLKEGNTLGLVANSANVLFEGAKGFLGGMGSANVQQQQKQDYYQKQREGMTGQNKPTGLKRGGRFSTFKLGGYQLPMYQEAGLYPGEEGSYGENESMDKYVNSEQQKRAISLRAEPGSATAEETPKDYVEPAKEQTPAFDSSSARDMWVHKTGMPWSKAKELGYTTGSAQDNIKLLSELKDERFKKENLRTEAPKRKTANRKKIELQPKASVPVERNAYGIDPNSPAAIAFRAEIDKNNLGKKAEINQKKKVGKREKTDKEIAAERQARINESIKYQDIPYTMDNWRKVLAKETQATGDKFRVSNEPNFFDDYVNPAVYIGNMASELGQAPYRAQQEDSYMPYISSVGTPLVAGATVGSLKYLKAPKVALNKYYDPAQITSGTRQLASGVKELGFELGGYYQKGGTSGMSQAELNSIAKKYNKTPEEFLEIINGGGVIPEGGTMIRVGGGNTGIPKNYLEAYREEQSSIPNTIRRMPEMMKKTANKGLNYLGIDYEFNNGGYYQEGGMQSPQEDQMGGQMPNPQEEQGEVPQQEQMQQIMQQISQALQQGADPQQILQQLVQMGIPQDQAQQMIQMAMQELQGGQQQAPQGTPQLRRGGYYQEGGEAMDEQMEGEDEGAEGESPSMEQIEDQVEQALKQGADPQQILEQLVQMGMPQEQAIQIIQEIMQEIQGGETEMEAPEQGTPQMRAGGKYLEVLKGKTIKSYTLNKKTGNYEVQYS